MRQMLLEVTGGSREFEPQAMRLDVNSWISLGKNVASLPCRIRALERMRRHLEVDVGVLRKAPQRLGGIVGRTVAHVGRPDDP